MINRFSLMTQITFIQGLSLDHLVSYCYNHLMVGQKLLPSTNISTNDSTGLHLKYKSMLSLVERFTKIPNFHYLLRLTIVRGYNGKN